MTVKVATNSATADKPALPWAHTAAAVYVSRQIDALTESGNLTQRQIAHTAGYDKPNILSMIKRGETKVPIDKIPDMAKALRVDPAHLARLVLDQHWPALTFSFEEIFGGGMITVNERKLLTLWRQETGNNDPVINDARTARLSEVFQAIEK